MCVYLCVFSSGQVYNVCPELVCVLRFEACFVYVARSANYTCLETKFMSAARPDYVKIKFHAQKFQLAPPSP